MFRRKYNLTSGPLGYSNYEFLINNVQEQDGLNHILTTTNITSTSTVTIIITNAAGCTDEEEIVITFQKVQHQEV